MARRSSIHDLENEMDALAAIGRARPLTDAESERLQRLHHEHQMWRSRLVRQIRQCREKLARLEGQYRAAA